MKKVLFVIGIIILYMPPVMAQTCVVSSCKSGYYVDGQLSYKGKSYFTQCKRCPGVTLAGGGTQYGTGAGGLNGIGSCFVPANKEYKDSSGTYIFTSQCGYSK